MDHALTFFVAEFAKTPEILARSQVRSMGGTFLGTFATQKPPSRSHLKILPACRVRVLRFGGQERGRLGALPVLGQ
jgi:hypothetical protein